MMAPPTTKVVDIPVLPLRTGISYLGEGAANIVYRISVPYPTPASSEIDEYGDDTPPPTEIEEPDYLKQSSAGLQIFESKSARTASEEVEDYIMLHQSVSPKFPLAPNAC
jgi:hypothetical protein